MLLLHAQVDRRGSEKAGEARCSLRDLVRSPHAPARHTVARIRYQEATRAKRLIAAVHPTTNAIKEAGARTEFIGSGLKMIKLLLF